MAARQDPRGKRKQRGSLIHRGLYQNLITSEAKATAKVEEAKHGRALSHPRKAGNARNVVEVVIPTYIPSLRKDLPLLSTFLAPSSM